jgi:hypothetical protein
LSPDGIVITDLAPREVRGGVVRVSVHQTGKLNVSYEGIGVSGDAGTNREFETYHCEVIGSGEGTSLARWDFTEDPDRRLGLGVAQALVLTLSAQGRVTASVVVNARLARPGLRGIAERVRDLVLARSDGREYTIAFDIPRGT